MLLSTKPLKRQALEMLSYFRENDICGVYFDTNGHTYYDILTADGTAYTHLQLGANALNEYQAYQLALGLLACEPHHLRQPQALYQVNNKYFRMSVVLPTVTEKISLSLRLPFNQ